MVSNMDDFFTPGEDDMDESKDQQTPIGPGKTPQALRNAISFGGSKG